MASTDDNLSWATPVDQTFAGLLGGQRYRGVGFTNDQAKRLERYYEFDLAHARQQAEQGHTEAMAAYEAELLDYEETQATGTYWDKQGLTAPEKPDPEGAG